MTTETEVQDPALVSALATVEKAKALVIRTKEESATAQAFVLSIDTVIKNAEAVLQPPVDISHEAWKKNVAHRDKYLVPLKAAKASGKQIIGAYLAEEQRKAEEARRAAEAKALAEQLARQKAEAEAAAAKAAALDKAGLKEEANVAMEEAVAIEQAAPAPIYIPPAKVEKAKGVSLGEDWKFTIEDPAKLPREYLVVDEVAVGRVVRALKGACSIPGVKVYSVPRVGLRSA